MDLLLYVLIGVVILIAGGVGLLVSRRSRRDVPTVPEAPVVVLPTEAPHPEAAEQAVEAPPVELPEPPASRLVRLRSRLARPQPALGRGLPALLSWGTVGLKYVG